MQFFFLIMWDLPYKWKDFQHCVAPPYTDFILNINHNLLSYQQLWIINDSYSPLGTFYF